MANEGATKNLVIFMQGLQAVTKGCWSGPIENLLHECNLLEVDGAFRLCLSLLAHASSQPAQEHRLEPQREESASATRRENKVHDFQVLEARVTSNFASPGERPRFSFSAFRHDARVGDVAGPASSR